MNNRLSVGGIFCDLEKNYDCISHEIILDKLEFSGISVKFQTLAQAFLRSGYKSTHWYT